MSFPVDLLVNSSHEDLEGSAQHYLSNLRSQNPNCPDFFHLPDHRKIPIQLSTVGFVPIYGGDMTHSVLALFAPEELFKAVALYLADRWWSIDDILRTSVCSRQGLHQNTICLVVLSGALYHSSTYWSYQDTSKVKSLGEKIVLYVLNRIIYRTQEMERDETPFLCHSKNDYAKILWQGGEAIGFYSVKPKGSVCSSSGDKSYRLSVLDTMHIRKRHRGKGYGLLMLEDFVDTFNEEYLGLRYPLSDYLYAVCKEYFEKYPRDHNLLWEVEGAGHWFQRKSVMAKWQREEKLRLAAAASQRENNVQAEDHSQQSAAVPEGSEQNTEVETKLNADSQKGKESADSHASTSEASVSIWTQISHLIRPGIGKISRESQTKTPQGDEENAHVPESRLELPAHASESPEDLVEVLEESEEAAVRNEGQPVSEAELHVSPPEKQSEEENPSEPLNGEVTEETAKASLPAEEEAGSEILSGESKSQTESQEEPVMLLVPLILESQAKPSEDTVSEKALNASDAEVLTEVPMLLEEGTEEQQESEKTTTENAAASESNEEPSDNGLPNSMVTEAAEKSALENVSPKTASSLEDQNEEMGHNSQEAPVALSQSSLIVVELKGVSFQQPSGQEGQKNQLEEHSEEAAEQGDQYMQTAVERAADSSSEEAEIEVPIVDRRNLRRKSKGYKGPPKKKGKPA